MLTTSAILKESNFFTSLPVVTQHVKIPTHRHGHTLDLIITPAKTTLNPIITSSHIITSDHYPIFTSINVRPNTPPPLTTFTYRRINSIDYPKFIDDLNSSPLFKNPPSGLPDLRDSFSQPFAHYSIITPLFSPKPINPFALLPLLGSPLKSSVLSSPAAVWNSPTSPYTLFFYLKLLRSATNRYHKLIATAKKSLYASLVQSSSSKPRALWKTINNSLQRTVNRSLLTSCPLAALSQLFATHFSYTISKLHFNLQTNPFTTPALSLPPSPTPLLHSFFPATLLEIDNLLSQSSDSYCGLDPVSTTD